jgi:hypothetical protein
MGLTHVIFDDEALVVCISVGDIFGRKTCRKTRVAKKKA